MSDPAGQATVDDALPASNGGRGASAGEKPGLIGVIAGMGRFPVLLVERLRADGYEVVVLGLRGVAEPVLEQLAHRFHWCGVAQIGKMARLLQREGVTVAVMAGKVEKKGMNSRFRLLHYRPDFAMLKLWYKTCRDKKDDTILGAFSQFLEGRGIHIRSSALYLEEVLAPEGVMTRRRPNEAEEQDYRFGFQVARELGRLDVGQSVVVREQAVIALEAIEGTDRCIQRAGELCPRGGFTVVKVAKPKQDLRFDVPTIGIQTVEEIIRAGGRCLAVESGITLFLDAEQALKRADEAGLAIVGVPGEESLHARLGNGEASSKPRGDVLDSRK